MAMIEKIYETTGPEETLQIGKQIGESSAAGEVYALIGDLGVGKTVFTKGFAEGLGIDDVACEGTDFLAAVNLDVST